MFNNITISAIKTANCNYNLFSLDNFIVKNKNTLWKYWSYQIINKISPNYGY